MNHEVIYEVYCYSPHEIGDPVHTLWLTRSKETAEYLCLWEMACEENDWYNFKKLTPNWNLSWEKYKQKYGLTFKVTENYLYD